MSDEFDKNMRMLDGAVSSIRERIRSVSAGSLLSQSQMSTELSTAMEELMVTEEELRQQNAELLRTQQELLEEQQRYRDLFELAPDAYFITDARGIIREANKAAAQLLNIRPKYLPGKALCVYTSPRYSAIFDRLLRAPDDAPIDCVLHLRPRDREEIEVTANVNSDRPGHHDLITLRWIMRPRHVGDKQERTRLADVQRLRRMLVQQSQEDQQAREALARRIHDELSQMLAVIRYQLQGMPTDIGATELHQWVRETDRFAAEASQLARDMTYQLSPPMLRDGELHTPLLWLVEQLSPRLTVRLDPAQPPKIDERTAAMLFHATRDLLLACIRRAAACDLTIGAVARDPFTLVWISDPRDGLSWVSADLESGDGLLARIRERVIGAGGWIDIHSEPGHGTTVRIALPHPAPARPPR